MEDEKKPETENETKNNVKMDVKEGTIKRTEITTVKYEPEKKPSLEMDITRPYKVTVTGQTEGTDRYHLVSKGRRVRISPKVSIAGLKRVISAVIDAYRNPALEGGITAEDVKAAEKGGEEFNKVVGQYGQVAGQTTAVATSKEMKIENLSDKEKTEFGLSIEEKVEEAEE